MVAIVFFTLSSTWVHAAQPTISTFTVSPSSISNNYNVSVAWNIDNSVGADLLITCPIGVYLKDTNGATVTCGNRFPVSVAVGSLGYTVTNVSGSSATVSVRLFPKDQMNVVYDALSTIASFTASSAVQPISDFSLSSTTVISGTPAALSWSGTDAPGSILVFSCADSVRLYKDNATTSAPLPCGNEVQTADLPISGTYVFTAVNTSLSAVPVQVTIRPAIAAGLYDASHGKTLSFTVAGYVLPPEPVVQSFSGTVSAVGTTTMLNLQWATKNAAGANIQITCTEGISFATSSNAKTLPCNTPAFSQPLTSSGTTTLIVTNPDSFVRPISLLLLPQKSNGTYQGTVGKSLSLLVPARVVIAAPQPPVSSLAALSIALTSTSTATRMPFLQNLKRGSKGADVTQLQQFLAQDTTIYPEGTVSGFYGPGTERAVSRFQEKYGLAKKGQRGYGTCGPATRAKINSLQTP